MSARNRRGVGRGIVERDHSRVLRIIESATAVSAKLSHALWASIAAADSPDEARRRINRLDNLDESGAATVYAEAIKATTLKTYLLGFIQPVRAVRFIGVRQRDMFKLARNGVRLQRARTVGRRLLGFSKEPSIESLLDRPDVQALANWVPVTRAEFDALEEELQRQAFTIAAAATKQQVKAAQGVLTEAISEGWSSAGFRKKMLSVAASVGMDVTAKHYWENVYRTNLMSAYTDGLEASMSNHEVAEFFGYRTYYNPKDLRSRPGHAAVDGATFKKDEDPIERAKGLPPFSYQCRCSYSYELTGAAPSITDPSSGARIAAGIEGF